MLRLSKKDKDFCKRLLTDIVNINSVSGEEEKIIKYLSKLFNTLGIKTVKVPEDIPRTNLVASLGKGKTKLCINAHADTVPPSGNSRPRAVLRSGKIYGLGTSDDKGSLAAAICAFKNLKDKEKILRGRVDFFISIGEERGGEGTNMGIKNGYRCDAAITCEATALNIGIAQSGVYFMELTTVGKAAHGSKPWEGKNAIFEMMALVNEIKKVVDMGKSFHSIGRASLNLGAIKGGDIPNRVPDYCTAKIDIRLMPGENLGRFKSTIKKIFKKKRWLSASYKIIQDKAPMLPDRKSILVKAMSSAAEKVIGKIPECIGIRGWTEAGNFGNLLNVPVIIFGPGTMGVAHSQNEWIKLSDVYKAAKIYEIFIEEALADGCL